MTTRAPSAANRVAHARPMPLAAPVMTTCLPASSTGESLVPAADAAHPGRNRVGGEPRGYAVASATARARWRSGVMRTTFQARPTRSIAVMISPEGSISRRRRP